MTAPTNDSTNDTTTNPHRIGDDPAGPDMRLREHALHSASRALAPFAYDEGAGAADVYALAVWLLDGTPPPYAAPVVEPSSGGTWQPIT